MAGQTDAKGYQSTAATVAAVTVAPVDLSPSLRHSIFLYLGLLIVLLAFGGPSSGLIDIPISFFLKNRLHLKAHEVANFRLAEGFRDRLKKVAGFKKVPKPLAMRNSKNAVVYYLFFASYKDTAENIVKYIFDTFGTH